MKKILGICMGVGALLLGSCSSEEPVGVNDSGGNVHFTATLPSEMVMSRSAYDDGLTATNLDYAVYDADGNNITALNGTGTFTDRQTTVSLSLVTGKTYTVVFWASADDAPYTFDAATGKVTVTTTGDANDLKRDAFFAYETFTVTGAISKTIELKRPFAQINIGTNDLASFTAAGGSITKSGVTVTAPNVLNLLDGTVSGEAEYALAPAAFLAESEAFPVEGTPAYRWLTTVFVLTGDAKTTVDVKWTSDNTAAGRDAVDFTFVPVQRNYRTNIYGALLTNPAEYNVIIDQNFETPDHDFKVWNGEVVTPEPEADGNYVISSPAELAGLNNIIRSGNNMQGKTITLAADIDLSNIPWTPIGPAKQSNTEDQFAGVFDGGGHTIKNLYIDQNGKAAGPAGLFSHSWANPTFRNLTIDGVNISTIGCVGESSNCGALAGSGQMTIDNVTVKNVEIHSYRRSGGIVGSAYTNISNCHAENIKIELQFELLANGDWDNCDKAGAIAGHLGEGKYKFENNTAKNVTLSGYRHIGGLFGYTNRDNVLTNNTIEGGTLTLNNEHNYKSFTDFSNLFGEISGQPYTDGGSNSATNVTITLN